MDLNFYQSNIWKDINKYVLNKPTFEIEFMGKKYFGIVKEKKTLFVTLKWYQVLGISLGENRLDKVDEIKKEIDNIVRDFGKGYGNILFQFGFIDPIHSFLSQETKEDGFDQKVLNIRKDFESKIKDKLGLQTSFRENMPLATVYFDLTIGEEQLFKNMSKSARAHIKKAMGKQLYFEFANEDDWELFYDIWHQTSADKDFNIIRKKTFLLLKDYLLENKCGNLFLAKKNGKIVSGSLCLFIDNSIVYLYGATNRNFGNVGGHQFLKNEIFKRGSQNGYKYADLLGVAPSGDDNHHLVGVSKFKESLGGTKIEYLGNYDLVLDKKLYQTFKLFKTYKTNIILGSIAAKSFISEKAQSIKGNKTAENMKKDSTNTTEKETKNNDAKDVSENNNKSNSNDSANTCVPKEEKKQVSETINKLKKESHELENRKIEIEESHDNNLINELEIIKKKIEQINESINQKESYMKSLEDKYTKLENKINLQNDKKIYFKVSDTTKCKLFDIKICIIGFGTGCKKIVENIIQERFFETNGLNSKNILYIDTGMKEGRQTSIKTIAKYDIIIIGQNDHILADMTMSSKNAIYDELIDLYKHKNVHVRTKNKKPYLNEGKIKEMVFEGIRIINNETN